jgi:uncharacterized protein (UPF0333 family)
MKLAIDGKIPKEFWILLLVALLALVGASHETILEVVI